MLMLSTYKPIHSNSPSFRSEAFRWLQYWVAFWLVVSAGSNALAQISTETKQQTLPSLFSDSQQLSLSEPLRIRAVQSQQTITLGDLLALPADQWAAWDPNRALPTSPNQDVWLRLVLPAQAAPQTWMLRIPRLSLEKATLYSRPADNNAPWQSAVAGKRIASENWPLRSRDPVFELTTRIDQTQLFLIRVENRVPVTENIQLIQSKEFADGANRVGTLNGLIIGLFMIMTLMSLVNARINRSPQFAWFALFTFAVMLAQLTLTGYMMVRVWPSSIFLNQTMGWVLPLLSLAALTRYALEVSYAKDLSRTIYFTLWTVAGLCFVASALVMIAPDNIPRFLLNGFFALGMLTVLVSLSWIAWSSQHWLWWVVVSLVPVFMSAMARLAYNLGWVAHVEIAMLASVITACLGLLATYNAMVLNQRQRAAGVQRQDALESTDGATGLYNERIAMARLPQVILRSRRFGKPCAAMLVRWVDCNQVMQASKVTERGRIFAHLGNRLGRLARDIDTVARVGDDLFMFLVEAPISREQLSQLASHVLTTCLRPSPVMPDQQGFNLHMTLWLSSEVSADAPQVLELLKTRMNQMRDGAQKRVQFVDTPLSTGPMTEQQQAEHAQQLLQKINSIEATQGLPTIKLKNNESIRPQ